MNENIEVKINLNDLKDLKDYASYYESASAERNRLFKENSDLRKKLEEIEAKLKERNNNEKM